jgi:hypothetical protein
MSLEIYILEGFKELTSEAGTVYPCGTPLKDRAYLGKYVKII